MREEKRRIRDEEREEIIIIGHGDFDLNIPLVCVDMTHPLKLPEVFSLQPNFSALLSMMKCAYFFHLRTLTIIVDWYGWKF